MAFDAKRDLSPALYDVFAQGPLAWPLFVQTAMKAGIRDADRLASIVFYLHHPERSGRQIDPAETGMVAEWKSWRTLIKPLVGAKKEEPKISEGIVIATMDGRKALLCDFDIDQAELKAKHRGWLDGLGGIVRGSPLRPPEGIWIIAVTGRASKTGSTEHNSKLSERRAQTVREYLAARMPGIPIQWAPTALGEIAPHDASVDESALDRSVHVVAMARLTPDPRRTPDPPRIITPKPYDLVVEGYRFTVSRGLTVRKIDWVMNLTITDIATDFSASYIFKGSGPSNPTVDQLFDPSVWLYPNFGKLEGRSAGPGSAQPFKADRKTDETSFEGYAAFSGLGWKTLFRFGGHRYPMKGQKSFAMGEIKDLQLPKPRVDASGRARTKPFVFSATGTLERGFADI
jgi:OmpA family